MDSAKAVKLGGAAGVGLYVALRLWEAFVNHGRTIGEALQREEGMETEEGEERRRTREINGFLTIKQKRGRKWTFSAPKDRLPLQGHGHFAGG